MTGGPAGQHSRPGIETTGANHSEGADDEEALRGPDGPIRAGQDLGDRLAFGETELGLSRPERVEQGPDEILSLERERRKEVRNLERLVHLNAGVFEFPLPREVLCSCGPTAPSLPGCKRGRFEFC